MEFQLDMEIEEPNIPEAQIIINSIRTEIQNHFQNPEFLSLLDQYNQGLNLYIKWYPKFRSLIRTTATYYHLPINFSSDLYHTNAILRDLRRQLNKTTQHLSLDRHPILDS